MFIVFNAKDISNAWTYRPLYFDKYIMNHKYYFTWNSKQTSVFI
jgi:hypothetical protein